MKTQNTIHNFDSDLKVARNSFKCQAVELSLPDMRILGPFQLVLSGHPHTVIEFFPEGLTALKAAIAEYEATRDEIEASRDEKREALNA